MCIRDSSRTAVFVAFYQAVGTVLFGAAILMVTDNLVHREAYERAKMANAFMHETSPMRVRKLLGDTERVTFGEFVVLEFVRQGRLDCDSLEVLRHAFDDVVGDGSDRKPQCSTEAPPWYHHTPPESQSEPQH